MENLKVYYRGVTQTSKGNLGSANLSRLGKRLSLKLIKQNVTFSLLYTFSLNS